MINCIVKGALAFAGGYLIISELGLEDKTPLLYVGIALLIPALLALISRFKK